MRRLVRSAVPALVLWMLEVASLGAQHGQVPAETAERNAKEAMAQLRSPVTPMHTLDMCPAEEAAALRDTVRIAAAQGMSSQQIVEGVIARRGESLRVLPKRSGVGLFAWVLPPLFLLAGAALVVGRLRRSRMPDVTAPPLTDAERGEIRAALVALEAEQG